MLRVPHHEDFLLSAKPVNAQLQLLNPKSEHVAIWYILRTQKGSHVRTLEPKYLLQLHGPFAKALWPALKALNRQAQTKQHHQLNCNGNH